jgi:hypothetical protein
MTELAFFSHDCQWYIYLPSGLPGLFPSETAIWGGCHCCFPPDSVLDELENAGFNLDEFDITFNIGPTGYSGPFAVLAA